MLRQVNPSSDSNRFGRRQEADSAVLRHSPSRQPRHLQEQLSHEPPNLHPFHETHDSAESNGQHSPPSQLRLDSENEHRIHIPNPGAPEKQISQHQSNQADNQHGFTSVVFRGSDLVDWLLERGLCAGRIEAEIYGGRLQQGGVLDHLTGQHSFRDEPTLLYCFIPGKDEPEEEDEQDRR